MKPALYEITFLPPYYSVLCGVIPENTIGILNSTENNYRYYGIIPHKAINIPHFTEH
jgi:hypothetical protein